MTRPQRFLLRMVVFLAFVVAIVAALEVGLQSAFLHNVRSIR